MKEEPTNKCKEQGLVHAWQDITSNVVLLTNPPQYPDKEEQCMNCGLVRTYRTRKEEWFEYRISEIQKTYTTSVLIQGNGTTTSDSGVLKFNK